MEVVANGVVVVAAGDSVVAISVRFEVIDFIIIDYSLLFDIIRMTTPITYLYYLHMICTSSDMFS